MRIRSAVLVAITASALATPLAFAGTSAPTPQVTDAAGDANFVNDQGQGNTGDNATPVGNQTYADVLAVTWAPDVVKGKRPTGFTVTTLLSAPPTPPSGTAVVYRMLGQVNGDAKLYMGPVYYTSAGSDPSQPQAALRDNLSGVTRLTKIDLPKIDGSTITWTIPFTALPKEFKIGSALANLYFEVKEIEDFHGQSIPSGVPSFGGAYGLGTGLIDNGSSTNSFKIG